MKRHRPDLSVILAGADRVLRVDVREGRGSAADDVLATIERARPDGSLADAVAAVFDGAHDKFNPERVLVLDELAWTQTLDLPAAALNGLDDDACNRALAYELEPFSGIPVDDSTTSFVRSSSAADGKRLSLWATQVRTSERDALENFLSARKMRLIGITHPAGILDPDSTDPHIEIWDQATRCVGNGSGDQLVISARPGQRSWADSIEAWLANANGTTIRWHGRARPDALGTVTATIEDRGDFGIEDNPAAFADIALRALRSEPARVPIAPPRPRETPRFEPRHVGIAAFALVAILCAIDWFHLDRSAAALENDVASADQRASNSRQLAGTTQQLDRDRAELRQSIDELRGTLAAIETAWDAQRARLPQLLRALSELRPDEVVLHDIQPEPPGLLLRGIGLEQAAVDGFAEALGDTLRGSFDVRPAQVGMERTDHGARYCSFTIRAMPSRSELP